MNKFTELVIEILQEEVRKNIPLFEKRFIDANHDEAEIEPMLGAKIKYFVHNWMEEDFERLRKEIFEKETKEV